ncbi:hypothetical protein DL93DRAFT_2100872 [Clavulina sp. PMI_390]|nr:hypothetical protein DL93DRAFT_2100872 [Clavulina sp. PMI_390]
MSRVASRFSIGPCAFSPTSFSKTRLGHLRWREFGRASSVGWQLHRNSPTRSFATSYANFSTLNVRLSNSVQGEHEPPPEETGLNPRYDAPSPELIARLNALRQDEVVDDKVVKDKIIQALEMAPTISVIHPAPRHKKHEHVVEFRDLIDNIDSFLDEPLGRIDDVLLFRAEIVRLQRALSFNTPPGSPSNSDLARFIRNLAIACFQNDQYAEACLLDEEALLILRQCYRARPGHERRLLAQTLYHYSQHLYADERTEEALRVCEELIPIERLLYEFDPEECAPMLAMALQTLGLLLSAAQRFEEARVVEDEALAVWRILYHKDPETHRSSLATSLSNYIVSLKDLGLPKEKRAAQAELDELKALMQ